jgi:hypothetical protein
MTYPNLSRLPTSVLPEKRIETAPEACSSQYSRVTLVTVKSRRNRPAESRRYVTNSRHKLYENNTGCRAWTVGPCGGDSSTGRWQYWTGYPGQESRQ